MLTAVASDVVAGCCCGVMYVLVGFAVLQVNCWSGGISSVVEGGMWRSENREGACHWHTWDEQVHVIVVA